MFGQNYLGDKWFNGAVDQVMLWNRALSSDEIRKYMMDNPRLDAPGLVSFVDMDHKGDDGKFMMWLQVLRLRFTAQRLMRISLTCRSIRQDRSRRTARTPRPDRQCMWPLRRA